MKQSLSLSKIAKNGLSAVTAMSHPVASEFSAKVLTVTNKLESSVIYKVGNQQNGEVFGYYENGSVFTSFSNKILQKKVEILDECVVKRSRLQGQQ